MKKIIISLTIIILFLGYSVPKKATSQAIIISGALQSQAVMMLT